MICHIHFTFPHLSAEAELSHSQRAEESEDHAWGQFEEFSYVLMELRQELLRRVLRCWFPETLDCHKSIFTLPFCKLEIFSLPLAVFEEEVVS